MKILLVAGTGTIGKHIVELLINNGNELFITTRSVRMQNRKGIHYLSGNAHDMTFLKKVFDDYQNWDAIIDFMVYSTAEFKEKVNLYLRYSKHYIFFSSARVYDESLLPIVEESPLLLNSSQDKEFLSTDEYALLKARQENILNNGIRKNYTIIRPYITYGEDRLQLGIQEHEVWLRRALSNKHIVFPKEIAESITTLTHAYDVAQSVCALICNDKAYGETFHITTDTYIKWNDVLEIYKEVLTTFLGKKISVKYTTNDSSLKLYQAKYDRLFTRIFDNSKINEFVRINTFKSPREGLKQSLESFLENPQYRNFPINWKNEAQMDRIGDDRSFLQDIPGLKNKLIYLFFRYTPSRMLLIISRIKHLIF